MIIKTASKFVMLFAAAGLSIASAKSYEISIPNHAQVAGTEIKSGDYSVKVEGTTATLRGGDHKNVQFTGSVQTADKKFTDTAIEVSTDSNGVNHIKAIDLGGTNTKLAFNN